MSKFMGVAITPSEEVVCCCGRLVEFDDTLENDDDVKDDWIFVDLLDGVIFEMLVEKM